MRIAGNQGFGARAWNRIRSQSNFGWLETELEPNILDGGVETGA